MCTFYARRSWKRSGSRSAGCGLLATKQHLEQVCEDLERNERVLEATATDISIQLDEIQEQNVLLEQDMAEFTEQSDEQHQRLKD